MKTIHTRYSGPTNSRGARILVTDGDNRMSISYPYDLSREAIHWHAVEAFMKRMKWDGSLVAGHTKDGMVFVFVDGQDIHIFSKGEVTK